MKNSCRSTGIQTADLLITTGVDLIDGVLLRTDGTNAATVALYDNTSAAGAKVFEASIPGAALTAYYPFDNPIRVENGLFADVSGTGASYAVLHG